jgi:hypothetical protein
MERAELLEKLGRATDRAATFALQRGVPVPISKKSVLIGNVFIEKSKQSYNVVALDYTRLYEDISVFDVAVIIAQRYNAGEISAIKQVLLLEDKFSKYHTDMVHYLNCMKSAKKNNDNERLAILEDKFQVAEILARDVRDRISSFKRIK